MLNDSSIIRKRLWNQHILQKSHKKPAEVVEWLGAMQAQNYDGACWSIGLRMQEGTEGKVEQAIAGGTIVRSWPLRGTLHFVAAADIHWILGLATPRIITGSARRYQQLELDEFTFGRAGEILARALHGGRPMIRKEVGAVLEQEGITTGGQRLYHILRRLGMDRLICFGPRRGKQDTFVLLDEWVPGAKVLEREEALGKLVTRYFRSRGPATLYDFVWWSGLTVRDARSGLDAAGSQLVREKIKGTFYWTGPHEGLSEKISPDPHLLPGFDEYVLGYTDRSAVIDIPFTQHIVCSNGIFRPTLIVSGRVGGTWKRSFEKELVIIEINPFRPLSEGEKDLLTVPANHYGAFLGKPVRTSLQ